MSKYVFFILISLSQFYCFSQQNIMKIYDISFLKYLKQHNKKWVNIGFQKHAIISQKGVEVKEELSNELLLISLLRKNMGLLKSENSVFSKNGLLFIKESEKNHKEIERFLKNLEFSILRKVMLNIKIYEIPWEVFSVYISQNNEKTVYKDKKAKLLSSVCLQTFSSNRTQLPIIKKILYIKDRDAEIAHSSSILDPISGTIHDGLLFDFIPFLSFDGKRIYLEGGVTTSKLRGIRSHFLDKTSINVELPSVSLQGILGTKLLEISQKNLFGFYTKNKQVRVIFITPYLNIKHSESFKTEIINTHYLDHKPQNYKLSAQLPRRNTRLYSNKHFSGGAFFKEDHNEPLEKVFFRYLGFDKHPKVYFFNSFIVNHSQEKSSLIHKAFDLFVKRMKTPIMIRLYCYEIKDRFKKKFLDTFEKQKVISAKDTKLISSYSDKVHTLQVSGVKGQNITSYSLNTFAFIRDYDVEIAQNAKIYDPIIDHVSSGISLEALPVQMKKNNALIWLKYTLSEPFTINKKIIISKYNAIEQPDIRITQVKGRFRIPYEKNYLLSIAENSLGKLVVFVTKISQE